MTKTDKLAEITFAFAWPLTTWHIPNLAFDSPMASVCRDLANSGISTVAVS